MRLNAPLLVISALIAVSLSGAWPTRAAAQSTDIPDWLLAHVGTGDGQIAPVVLERARALYREKVSQGTVTNPCYFAKDATRPSTARDGSPGKRFYVICEDSKTFRAASSGFGNGRKLKQADFSNGRECAKNFSNAEGSKLTMGGAFVTAETRTTFKGYYDQSGEKVPFYRTFLLYDGQGETENSREREIGGHPAIFLKWQCRIEKPESPFADKEGYVPFGKLVNYTGGRSNGCTTWSLSEADEILKLARGTPTTLYVYPESRDIDAVANAASRGTSLASEGLYWNAKCLSAIRSPRFWPKSQLQPVIDAWRDSLPKLPPLVLPVCK